MKSYTIIIAVSALALSSIETFAQGKVSISSTSQQLLTYSTDPAKLLPADAAKAGTVVASRNAGSTPGDFKFQLWGASGNTATLDQLVAVSSVFAVNFAANGRMQATSVTLPDGSGGMPAMPNGVHTFQIRFMDKQATSWSDVVNSTTLYRGTTMLFTATAGSAPNNLSTTGTPTFSSWGPGAIEFMVPEPASASIVGLGLASLLIFRRRK
jgi:hypothetical protein